VTTQTLGSTLDMLSSVLESKDSYTAEHASEVARLAERVGVRLRRPEDERRRLRYAALLHDIGKIRIPDEVLSKPGPLTADERRLMEQHTVLGAEMLAGIPLFADVAPLVRWSHERWDGKGYPDGLRGAEAPLGARIVAACDAFHAMTSDRPYRGALPRAVAIGELVSGSGTQFDPAVVDALLDVLRD
jgi:putative nucleotidyltransferase with HDIG domain